MSFKKQSFKLFETILGPTMGGFIAFILFLFVLSDTKKV